MNEIPGMDEASRDRLLTFIGSHGLVEQGDDVAIRLTSGGRSNLTYVIETAGRRLVLRRPPLGHVLSTAHDMGREYTVLSGLGRADAAVPVPATIALCEDDSVLGAPFYLMEYVAGDVLRTAEQTLALPADQQRRVSADLSDVLAALHRIEPGAVGLGDFGRPAGFMERQVRRWTRQLENSRSREIDGIEELAAGLGSSVPAQRHESIVHGDYRLDNCLVRDGRIAAVLDWEMSTLGDPLSDVGLFIIYHAGLADIDNPVVQAIEGLGSYRGIDELLDRYATSTGYDLADLSWYVAFAWFKFAVILEGIHYRSTLGATLGVGFEGVAELVQPSVEHGRDALGGGWDR